MSDSKSLAAIVLIVSLYALYLHAQGRLIPLWRFTTNTPPQGQTGAAAGGGTLIQQLQQTAVTAIQNAVKLPGGDAPFNVGGLKTVPIAPTTPLPQLPGN